MHVASRDVANPFKSHHFVQLIDPQAVEESTGVAKKFSIQPEWAFCHTGTGEKNPMYFCLRSRSVI
jgi:hypothetical protein